jgi:hypothetical protein
MLRCVSVLVLACVAFVAGAQAPGTPPLVKDPNVAKAMTAAARTLLESVRGAPEFSERLRNYSMEDRLLLKLEDPQRPQWVYWPADRSGLSIALMHAKHRALLHELLWTLTSAKGYQKLLNIMQLENFLEATSSTGFPRGIEAYTVTLFGEPRDDAPWAWRFEGHHLSLSITVAPGQGFTVTPTFLGADPAEVPFGPLAGVRVLRVEEDLGRQLITSLTDAQRKVAVLKGDADFNAKAGYKYDYDAPWDLHASNIMKPRGEWDAWKTELKPDGIAFSALNGASRRRCWRCSTRCSRRTAPRSRACTASRSISTRSSSRGSAGSGRASRTTTASRARTSSSNTTTPRATATTCTRCGAAAMATSARTCCAGTRRRSADAGVASLWVALASARVRVWQPWVS